ncbi:MAG: cyclase family protein [Streptosporangiaceae bacterium]
MAEASTRAPGRAPGLDGHELVDCTLLVAEDLPCWWSRHMPYQHKTFNYFEDRDAAAAPVRSRGGPYQTRWLLIDEHTGTHVDAPAHFLPPPGSGLPNAGPMGDVHADGIGLDQLMGAAAVIDVPADLPGGTPGVSPCIGPRVVTSWEETNGRLREGEIVLFRTGWDARYLTGDAGSGYVYDVLVTKTAAGWPAPDVDTMELLLERGVRCVGTDAPSMGSSHDGGPVHVTGLSGGAVYIEALTGLDALPVRGAWFCFAPLKLRHGTGAPGRAFAFVPRER